MEKKAIWVHLVWVLFALGFLAACSSEEGLMPTGSSPVLSGPDGTSMPSLRTASHSKGGSESGEGESESEDDSDDDDESGDDDGSDDNPSDDDSEDDDASEDTSGDNTRTVGLLFSAGSCATAQIPCAVTIGTTTVEITDGTRLDIEPMGLEQVSIDVFASWLSLGLPMKAEGNGGSTFVASRLRIDDELKAVGIVSGPLNGVYTLQVNGDPSAPSIQFAPAAGVDVPTSGMVRLEARVPADLSAPVLYEAFRVQTP